MAIFKGQEKVLAIADHSDLIDIWPVDSTYIWICNCALYLYFVLNQFEYVNSNFGHFCLLS